MAGRGASTFQKRQKEMQRKERQQEKFIKKIERKRQAGTLDSLLNSDKPDAAIEEVDLRNAGGQSSLS